MGERNSLYPSDSKPSLMPQVSTQSETAPQFSLGADDEESAGARMNRSASRSAKMDKMRNKDERKHKMKKRMSMDLGDVNVRIMKIFKIFKIPSIK